MSTNSPNAEPHTNWMHQPLAIVGMACRLPGGDGLDQFWNLLATGGHGIARFPDSFVDRELYLTDQKGLRGKSYSDVGGLIPDRPIDWSIMPFEQSTAGRWDPCHLILCEVAAQACRQAGYQAAQMRHSRTGVYIGHSGGSTRGGDIAYRTLVSDYVELLSDSPRWRVLTGQARERVEAELLARLRAARPGRGSDGAEQVDASCAAGLISQAFGLSGPHMSIDAACASSLVALALGANALTAGQIDMAIIGGASYNKFDSLILFSHAQSCSAQGQSRPFDAAADGLISSEGYVVFCIKTLAKAQADGDRIVAVVRGIGMSSDGRGRSLWAPRKEGQASAIQRAYSHEITADSVQMVEAHATSTQVGDATEMEALAGFFKAQLSPGKRIPVGSVKSNIGHTLETAGLAGLLKAVLAIHHGTIPPSIHVDQPNSAIAWNDIPLYVPHHCEPWPQLPHGQPRRAAVNAFGIGGLNVHVIVDQYLPTVGRPVIQRPAVHEPIAMIGRGLVVPGAQDLSRFAQLLQLGVAQVQPPPTARWRPIGSPRLPSDSLDVVGGYITDYQYDWRKHKVPPKQIAQANPLQFMLLEAAEQALREAGLMDKPWDRQRTAVVVGSAFGGDFGNALYAGLRLPEFQRHVRQLLADSDRGMDNAQIDALLQEFTDQFLKLYPALLDETGSFTSSTLASRLSKTFDLMGGAMAIDAADASALAALDAAVGLLRSGTVDQVLCATAQSALDRANFERLGLAQQLVTRAEYEQASPDRRRQLAARAPAEGVVLVLLKRLSAAQAAGDCILATIHEVSAVRLSDTCLAEPIRTDVPGPDLARPLLAASALPIPAQPLTLAPQLARSIVGNLHGAQGLLDLVECSVTGDSEPTLITQSVLSGVCYAAAVQAGVGSWMESSSETCTKTEEVPTPNAEAALPEPVIFPECKAQSRWGVLKLAAPDRQSLAERLRQLARLPMDQALRQATGFSPTQPWRAGLVIEASELSSKCELLAAQLGQTSALVPLAEQGLYWSEPSMRVGQIAWLFPGQGSQYPQMLRDLVAIHPAARAALDQCNQVLAELGQPPFEQMAWSAESQLGHDVWQTQASMLVADYLLWKMLRTEGFAPDVVAGHSYGEFMALLAAGCWDLPAALQATWHRCRAIVEHASVACGMLSIQASAQDVQRLIDQHQADVAISHRNAPQQTVVGGRHAAVAQFAQWIEGEGLVCRLLAVPTAFHTAALSAAQPAFAAQLRSIQLRPPRTTLLSSIDGRYAADPELIRAALVAQLVTPLDYVALVERLQRDGVRLVLEVGPQQVLTRLTRQIAGAPLICLSMDHLKRGPEFQWQSARVGLEIYDRNVMNSDSTIAAAQVRIQHPPARVEPIHFDATTPRRERLRQAAGRPPEPTPAAATASVAHAPVLQFDASQSRRQRNRQLPAAPAPDPKVDQQPHTSTQSTIESFLIDFVVEQTGYPAEIIELDWDIEADLGIDSIKKAQLFGELREFFDLESLTSFSLDSFRSLRDIVNLLVTVPGKGEWLTASLPATPSPSPDAAPSSAVPFPVVTPTALPAAITHSAPPLETAHGETNFASLTAFTTTPAISTDQAAQLERVLIDFVVEQTGYPAEIVEMEADLEADLGIDSIKKAQLFGELREMFTFPVVDSHPNQPFSLNDFRTLRSVQKWLLSALPPTKFSAQVSGEATTEDAVQPHTRPAAAAVNPNALVTPLELPTQPTEAPEFRQLSALQINEFPFAGPTALPLLQLQRSPAASAVSVLPTEGYTAAVFANLQAMTGRPHRLTDEMQVNYNGQRADVQRQVSALAAAVGAAEVSLLALDSSLLAQSRWAAPARESESPTLANKGNVPRVLLEYYAPSWLTSGCGIPLGLRWCAETAGPSLQWLTPGCVTSLTYLTPRGLLLSGGLLGSAAAGPHSDILSLATWIAEQSRTLDTLAQFERAARLLNLEGDWWAQCVDTQSVTRVLVECRQGVVVIEKGSLPVDGANDPTSLPTAQLLLDTQRQELIVRAQLRPKPYACDEARLPLAPPQDPVDFSNPVTVAEAAQPTSLTRRFVLRLIPAPLRVGAGKRPTWSGTALIVGDNPVAIQLEARLRNAQVPVLRWAGTADPLELARRFEEVSRQQSIRHLFLTTPCDAAALSTLDPHAWQQRRSAGLMSLFWLCQRWHSHILASGWADDASLVAVTTLGGNFGLTGQVPSIEGGGLSGLLKAILIESWVQGFRTFPIKVIDTCWQDSPAQIANCIWQELSVPNFDVEVAYCQGERHVVRAIARSLPESEQVQTHDSTARVTQLPWSITHGGNWVCTGGARGITAYVAEKLALKYQLKLHLIGTQPLPQINSSWRHLDEAGLRQLKSQVMTGARNQGKNPVTAWQDTEKALEIDRNLRRFQELGIEAHYHSCDVTDRAAVAGTLMKVRQISGPIRGVLHGAGIGKDARFDRKQFEKVEQCIGAKVDGAWSLIDATWPDPLEAFIGFGSISGRFGANGHTDYSLANDMLCKQMDWLRTARPGVHAVGFHWHAWGDIGMATKPETKLALEMIDMQFMPASEGIDHLLRELAGNGNDSEILITDDRYYRLFYTPELLMDAAGRSLAHLPPPTPLIKSEPKVANGREQVHVAELDPLKDPFLTEHRLDDRPLLPIVIGTELMLEAARAHLGNLRPLKLRNVRAHQGLKFFSDAVLPVRVHTSCVTDGVIQCRVMSDFHARDGRVVDRDRVNMSGEVLEEAAGAALTRLNVPSATQWHRPNYPAPGSKFFAGLPLQRLRGFAILPDGLVGRIIAPALIELAGGRRDVRGWQLPSSAVDACLFATGILAWQTIAPGAALPAGFGEIELGRAPWPGEACQVHVRMKATSPGNAVFDFTLYGDNQEMLVNVRDYQIAWLSEAASASPVSAAVVGR